VGSATDLAFAATASAAETDPAPADNAATTHVAVAVEVVAPSIAALTPIAKAGQPWRLRVSGTNFKPGAVVFIGSGGIWPSMKFKSAYELVIKGDKLKKQFPKGVAVPVRVVNSDGGETTATYTR
jgi:hypothetical protein